MPFTDYPNAYAGLLVALLAVLGAVKGRKAPVVPFLLLLAVVSLAMSFGRHLGPIYRLAYDHLPYFNKFRVPVMVVVLFHFSLACLAAYGVSFVLGLPAGRFSAGGGGSRSDAGRRRFLRWGMAGVAAALLLFLLASRAIEGGYAGLVASARGEALARAVSGAAFSALRADVILLGLLVLASGALVYAYWGRRLSVGTLALGLVFLSCADLWRVDYRLMKPNLRERGAGIKAVEEDPVAVFLSKDTDLFRVYPLGRMFSDNTLNAHKVASVGGYHAAKPKLWDEWANAHLDAELWSSAGLRPLNVGRDQRLPAGGMRRSVMRLLGVKYVVTDMNVKMPPEFEEVFRERAAGDPRGPGRVVYRTDDWLPKAFCVGRLKRVEDGRSALREILSSTFAPDSFAVVEEDVELQPGIAGSAEVLSYDLNDLEVRVESEAATFLIVNDLYMPGWEAKLDGRKVPIHKTDFLVRGVAVPAGVHTVRMEYHERGLERGLKLCVGSAIFIIAMALPASVHVLASLFRRRSGGSPWRPEGNG